MLTDTILYNRAFLLTEINDNIVTLLVNGKTVYRKLYKDKLNDDYFTFNNDRYWIKYLFEVN